MTPQFTEREERRCDLCGEPLICPKCDYKWRWFTLLVYFHSAYSFIDDVLHGRTNDIGAPR